MAKKEYIDKETVLKHFDEVMNNEFCDADFKKAALGFSIYVSRLDAADVAPVKHGHFRRLTFSNDTIICSECKMAYNIFETNGAENFNFCPHCGAKIMDGGEGE